MSPTLMSLATAILYATAGALQFRQIARRQQQLDRRALWLGLAALASHATLLWPTLVIDDTINFGFFKVSSLIFFCINATCVLSLARRPLQNLLVLIFPLSALVVLIANFAPATAADLSGIPTGVLIHIISSITAYALLSLAAVQALLVALLHERLKHKHTRGVVQVLPPLQLMETMLFELIAVGVLFLSLSIGTGFLFLEDMFAQHLVHKTALTLVAWALFSTLLLGHYRLGWRSQIAVRLTLSGFAALMLAYYGSKFVLELVLGRV